MHTIYVVTMAKDYSFFCNIQAKRWHEDIYRSMSDKHKPMMEGVQCSIFSSIKKQEV
jgi:hypothetical protein